MCGSARKKKNWFDRKESCLIITNCYLRFKKLRSDIADFLKLKKWICVVGKVIMWKKQLDCSLSTTGTGYGFDG